MDKVADVAQHEGFVKMIELIFEEDFNELRKIEEVSHLVEALVIGTQSNQRIIPRRASRLSSRAVFCAISAWLSAFLKNALHALDK